ncbi:MAG: AHH domain-containing protein [bacterium]|nr:AHH domain-containing protein [bacterium]
MYLADNYIINAHTRESLLDIESDDIERKIAFLEALAYYDSFLFDDKQGESVEAICRYNDSLNPSNDPSNLPPDSPDCSWNVLVICSDLNTQTTWFGGISNMPPHLDHDGDGIINSEDQDFLSLGITQDQFEDWLREWWLQNEYEHLGDYDQYFQNNGGSSWYNDYEEIMEFWEGIWQDMWLDWQDYIYDEWYDDHGYDDPRDPWDDPIYACGGGWYDPLDSPIEEREVRCFAYYVLDCGVGEFDIDNWQDVFSDYVPCLECPSYEDIFMERAFDYYDTHSQGFSYSFNSFDDLVQTAELLGCNGASPTFEQCINEAAVLSTFGLNYNTLLSQAAINWLIDRPVYPEGPDRIYVVARYIHLHQGGTEEAKTHAKNVLNWITSIYGFTPHLGEVRWLLENPDGFEVTKMFLDETHFDSDAIQSVHWTIAADLAGVAGVGELFSESSMAILMQYTDCCPEGIDDYDGWTDVPEGQAYAEILQDEILMLKQVYPGWNDFLIRHWAQWRLYKDGIHTLADVCGLIEGWGSACDMANGVFYAIEGDGTNAALSFLAAAPGGFYVTASRVVKKAVDIGGTTRRFAWRQVGNYITFSHAGSYRKVWKGVYPALNSSDNIAHHVIPQKFWDHPLVQKAARANPENLTDGIDPFHMNMPSNGWPVHKSRHTSNHQNYSDQIFDELEDWMLANPNASPEEAATALAQWQIALKNTIGDNPSNPSINTIDLPAIP